MIRCVECWKDWENPKGFYSNVCPKCSKPKELGAKVLHYTNLDGYGKVLTSRIKEMERRVIIDDPSSKTDYFVGRLGENGKIQERVPNYK